MQLSPSHAAHHSPAGAEALPLAASGSTTSKVYSPLPVMLTHGVTAACAGIQTCQHHRRKDRGWGWMLSEELFGDERMTTGSA